MKLEYYVRFLGALVAFLIFKVLSLLPEPGATQTIGMVLLGVAAAFVPPMFLGSFFTEVLAKRIGPLITELVKEDTEANWNIVAAILIHLFPFCHKFGYGDAGAEVVDRAYRFILREWSLPDVEVPAYAVRPSAKMLTYMRGWLSGRQRYLEKKDEPDAAVPESARF